MEGEENLLCTCVGCRWWSRFLQNRSTQSPRSHLAALPYNLSCLKLCLRLRVSSVSSKRSKPGVNFSLKDSSGYHIFLSFSCWMVRFGQGLHQRWISKDKFPQETGGTSAMNYLSKSGSFPKSQLCFQSRTMGAQVAAISSKLSACVFHSVCLHLSHNK